MFELEITILHAKTFAASVSLYGKEVNQCSAGTVNCKLKLLCYTQPKIDMIGYSLEYMVRPLTPKTGLVFSFTGFFISHCLSLTKMSLSGKF